MPVHPGGADGSLTDVGRVQVLGLVVTVCKFWHRFGYDWKLTHLFTVASVDGKKDSRVEKESLGSQTSLNVCRYALSTQVKAFSSTEGVVGRLVGTGVLIQTPVVGLDDTDNSFF